MGLGVAGVFFLAKAKLASLANLLFAKVIKVPAFFILEA